MAFDYDETNPLDSSYIADFPADERAHRVAVLGSVSVDHDAADTGKHNKVTLIPLGTDPSLSSTSGFLYTKEIATITELFYRDEGGQVIQLTDDGSASPDKVAIAGDAMTGDLDMQAADLLADNDRGLRGEVVATGTYHSLARLNTDDDAEFGDQAVPAVIQVLDANSLSADYPGSGGAKEVWHAGNDGDGSGCDADTVDGVEAEDVFSTLGTGRFFESAQQTVGNGDSATAIAHSLGGVPRLVMAVLVCTDAGGDDGFAQNDEITLAWGGVSQNNRGVIFGANATNVFYTRSSGTFYVLNLSTGVETTIDTAKWRLVIRAWK